MGLIINYLQCATEVAQCATSSCSRPQLATDNGVRDGRSVDWQLPPLRTGQYSFRGTYTVQIGGASAGNRTQLTITYQQLLMQSIRSSIEVVVIHANRSRVAHLVVC